MTPEELRQIRLRLGLSQMELAERLGVSISTVLSWEKGRRAISHVVALAIRCMVEHAGLVDSKLLRVANTKRRKGLK
ncbi:MAG: transcriptional regulator [Candidatus Dadabacteria bacterium]